ncbi:MAG: DUF6782 family putative metallopeptidase [Alphaproteobacteria bacterium]
MQEEFNASSADRVKSILDRLSKVPEGRAVVDFLKNNAVKIDLQDDPENWAASTLTITDVVNGVYAYKNPVIILKKSLSDDNLLQAIVHESQHLRQHLSGTGNPDRILSQEEYILFYRASEADAQAACTFLTWKLKETGDAGPWKMAGKVGYQDICDAFEKIATADPESLNDGRAQRAAFDAWFENTGRLKDYNKATIDSMIPFLEEGRDIFKKHGMTQGALDESWLKKLHVVSPSPYLVQDAGKNILTDAHYSRDMDKRPPEKKKKPPANDSGPPAKVA